MQKSATIGYEEIEKEIKRMQSIDKREREESLQGLHRIAKEIGKVCTVQYMVPFIKMIIDTNEEAKPIVIKQVEMIIISIVCDVHPFIPIFKEMFLTCRQKTQTNAATTLVSCAVNVPNLEKQVESIEKLICELGRSEFITQRISSLCLLSCLIEEERTKKYMQKMRGFFEHLISDSSLVVRRHAASSISIIRFFYYPNELSGVAEKIFNDSEDSVRSCFIHPLFLMPKTEESNVFFIKMFSVASADISWQVRKVSVQIIKLALEHMHEQRKTTDSVIESIRALVGDREELVREEAVKMMPEIAKVLGEEKDKIMQLLDKASTDSSPVIRRIVPEALLHLSESQTKEEIEQKMLLVMKKLLADEDSVTKMNTIFILCRMYKRLGPSAIAHALTLVIADLESSNWRTRSAILKSISSLSTQIEKGYFSVHLKGPFFKMFTDPIWAVRKESATVLAEIASIFGAEWVEAEALPALEFLRSSPMYIHRISYVSALREILRKKWPEKIQSTALSALMQMVEDPVPQVRLAVAKSIPEMHLQSKEALVEVLRKDTHAEVMRAL